MNLGQAVEALRARRLVRRAGWNGQGQYLGLQLPDAGSANTLQYVYLRTVAGDRVPWTCSQTDLLAEDWETIPWTESEQ